jgi:hypothetical protein
MKTVLSDKRIDGSLGGFARDTARNRQASFGHACNDLRLRVAPR